MAAPRPALPHSASRSRRRAVLVVCDGLGAEWVTPELTPVLHGLQAQHASTTDHRAVFPSVTRVSAASVATGCLPSGHGLHGNQVALLNDGRLVVHNVGDPGFRRALRLATGGTLKAPTMAERLAWHGGQVAFSNVSPGAAYFLDPEHHGHVLHRAGSYGPGGVRLSGHEHLDVSHDLAGDIEMARRFCKSVIEGGDARLGILWLANPDLTLHHHALGSPAHLDALRVVDRIVSEVCTALQRSARCADTLLLVGSDHGHETIGASIHIGEWLAERGLGEAIRDGRIAIASQGTAALLYAIGDGRAALDTILPEMRRQRWAASVRSGAQLLELGLDADGAIVAAIDGAWLPEVNPFGVGGARWMIEDGESPPEFGCGQHGGLGAQERSAFLTLARQGTGPARIERSSSLVDIAPTILDFLSLDTGGMDGRSLLHELPALATP